MGITLLALGFYMTVQNPDAILDITKIEAGKLTIIPVEYGFSSMIHDVVSMISFKAKAKGLEFQVIIDERIPSKLVGEDVRIRQILLNLLNNAIKYTHEGTVTLEVQLLPQQQKGVSDISFMVKDTGIGIKKEDIPKLFVPFERIEERRNRNIEGTGLEMNRKVFCSLLKDTKIQIEEAASGKESIEKVKKEAFHIIFMDHMMPEMDGVETLKVMKQMGDFPSKDAPVVILTANAIVGAKERYLKEGFDAFLSKPIDFQKLESLIEELLDDSLIHQVEREVSKPRENVDISELPVIDGLDWSYAVSHFKDVESMINTLKLFASYSMVDTKSFSVFIIDSTSLKWETA